MMGAPWGAGRMGRRTTLPGGPATPPGWATTTTEGGGPTCCWPWPPSAFMALTTTPDCCWGMGVVGSWTRMLEVRLPPARAMLLVAALTMAMVSADGGIGFIVTAGCGTENIL